MTLAELIAQFRVDAEDSVAPYLFTDAVVTGFLNEAEEEAALRANLLHESSDPSVCEINVVAGTSTYPLHASVFAVTYATWTPSGSTERIELTLIDRIEADRTMGSDWRTRSKDPSSLIIEDTRLRLTCIPLRAGLLRIECYRAPLTQMIGSDDTPKINRAHHRHLVQWALHRGFSIPDKEVFDPGRAEIAEAKFTRQFGIRPDADMRRASQANRPLTNKAVW